MIKAADLRDALKAQVRDLEVDLRERFKINNDYNAQLSADWKAAYDAGRIAEALEPWVEVQFTQSAVAWVLASVFVRFCEDNGLLDEPLIVGTNSGGQSAEQRQQTFYLQNPTASDNDYLRDVFGVAARLPGLSDVLKVQQSLLAAPVSADMGKQLIRFFRSADPDSGTLIYDFADPEWSTRFLGDLYQDLSESARERYALLQTPEFVESFILDRTLTPALAIYTLEEVDLIDPTCGSGHFLLGAFERLAPRWLRHKLDNTNLAIQEALNRIAGIDLNPYAVAIARFRLLVAALKLGRVQRLRLAPDFRLRVETGDSLLHGFDQRDYTRAQEALDLDAPQANLKTAATSASAQGYRHAFAAEDLAATNAILAHKYAAVVGNPPYITVKDRAVSALYRQRYRSCFRTYALVVPFCERFWSLARARDATDRAGFVGMIVANSFMKREFGRRLIQEFFPQVDLSHVVDMSGAYVPGHGTPTAILLGRQRPPSNDIVRAVMGIKGEPETPRDPANGIVWNAILNQIDLRDSISEWVSVSDVARVVFSRHPWTVGGGGAADLAADLADERNTLADEVEEIGYSGQTNADGVFLASAEDFERAGVETKFVRRFVVGDVVRDWIVEDSVESSLFPYSDTTLIPLESIKGFHRWVWPHRTVLGNRATFSGGTYFSDGRPWWEWHQISLRRFNPPESITFSFVATHNHFALDNGGKVFNRSAQIIKLKAGSSEDDYFGLIGLLNSSLACFWLKQVCHNKGSTVDQHGARQRTDAFEDFYEFAGTVAGRFPLASQRPTRCARAIHQIAADRARLLPASLIAAEVPQQADLSRAKDQADHLQMEAISLQEELDWQVYGIYGITGEGLVYEETPPPLSVGQRAFEVFLARQCAEGSASTTWFDRHRAQPMTHLPSGWPSEYREVVERRIAAIQRMPSLGLVERPEFKRRWAAEDWTSLQKVALERWILRRLEQADLWPRDAQSSLRLRSVRELVDALSGDGSFRRALDLYAGSGSDAHATAVALVRQASVPYLDALRYTESGLRKRIVWLRTWGLQRREDEIDAKVVCHLEGRPIEEVKAEQVRRKEREVGAIAVPPKYKKEDFSDVISWKLRGTLDVPKERFVSFPGLERASDAGSPIVLWAGYDAQVRALALTGYIYELQQRESTDQARLAPALAGLDEMLPWVHQWHPEVDDALGMSTGDYLQGLLDAQLAQHGFTIAEARAWKPPAPVRRARGRRSSAA
jgi:hypothetical protein